MFKCLSFFFFVFGIGAIISYSIASKHWFNELYVKYHSIWDCCVFSTAGIVILLRYKLDQRLYPSINGREQVTSVDSMQDVELSGI